MLPFDLQSVPGRIFFGNLLFTACCGVYLLWWSVTFRPGYSGSAFVKSSLLLLTAALGVVGLVMVVKGCMASSGRFLLVVFAGIIIYALLLLLTSIFLHRQVTTELMLIIFWVCMELCAMGALQAESIFSATSYIVITIIVIIAAVVSMICYLKYYNLEPMTAFYDGMVPLILFGLCSGGLAVYQLLIMKT